MVIAHDATLPPIIASSPNFLQIPCKRFRYIPLSPPIASSRLTIRRQGLPLYRFKLPLQALQFRQGDSFGHGQVDLKRGLRLLRIACESRGWKREDGS